MHVTVWVVTLSAEYSASLARLTTQHKHANPSCFYADELHGFLECLPSVDDEDPSEPVPPRHASFLFLQLNVIIIIIIIIILTITSQNPSPPYLQQHRLSNLNRAADYVLFA